MTDKHTELLRAAIRYEIRLNREDAFRLALKHAGYLPHSIDVAVAKNRKAIDRIQKAER